jgi:hypothetical protein
MSPAPRKRGEKRVRKMPTLAQKVRAVNKASVQVTLGKQALAKHAHKLENARKVLAVLESTYADVGGESVRLGDAIAMLTRDVAERQDKVRARRQFVASAEENYAQISQERFDHPEQVEYRRHHTIAALEHVYDWLGNPATSVDRCNVWKHGEPDEDAPARKLRFAAVGEYLKRVQFAAAMTLVEESKDFKTCRTFTMMLTSDVDHYKLLVQQQAESSEHNTWTDGRVTVFHRDHPIRRYDTCSSEPAIKVDSTYVHSFLEAYGEHNGGDNDVQVFAPGVIASDSTNPRARLIHLLLMTFPYHAMTSGTLGTALLGDLVQEPLVSPTPIREPRQPRF